jgi:membrane-associated HD superfamily phosphohydrolase
MPIISRPSVELTCALPVQGFITSLAYNLLLVAMCTYYAFRTRTLPDNFNESRYITLCVYTTLIIWLAFLPSYFTNNYAFYQSILLSCALVLSATVILLCLFLPKVYAVLTMVSEVATENCSTQTTGLGFKYNATRFSTSNTGRELYKVDDDNTEMTEFISIPRNGSTVSAPTALNGCST